MMDENQINNFVQECKILKYKFVGVFAADNFPVNLSHNKFISVNISTSRSIGTHWTLICRKNGDYVFADPLGQNITSYKRLHNRLFSSVVDIRTVYELLRNQPIQKPNSLMCGLFCVKITHYLSDGKEDVKMSDVDLICFALHMML